MNFISELTYTKDLKKSKDAFCSDICRLDNKHWSSIHMYNCIFFINSYDDRYALPFIEGKIPKVGNIYLFDSVVKGNIFHITKVFCCSTGEELFSFENPLDISIAMAKEIKESNEKLLDELNDKFEELTPESKAVISCYQDWFYSQENMKDIFDYLLYKKYINLFHALEKATPDADFDLVEERKFYDFLDIFIRKEFHRMGHLFYLRKNIELKPEIFEKYNVDIKNKNKSININDKIKRMT